MFPAPLIAEAEQLLAELRASRLRLATAESCTGGLLAALLTEVPDASEVLERGFVTYSNAAKTEMLGVPYALLADYGAVSPEVALAMADGALRNSRADVAVAVTGLAGPGGGTAAKPVGLVHVAAIYGNLPPEVRECRFAVQSRSAIRLAAVEAALDAVRRVIVTTY